MTNTSKRCKITLTEKERKSHAFIVGDKATKTDRLMALATTHVVRVGNGRARNSRTLKKIPLFPLKTLKTLINYDDKRIKKMYYKDEMREFLTSKFVFWDGCGISDHMTRLHDE